MLAPTAVTGDPLTNRPAHSAPAIWPLGLALSAYLLAVTIPAVTSVRRHDGHVIYLIDDAYIHMAVAKNLAEHRVWGVTRYEFSSSSSSLLWTIVLASGYALTHVSDLAPLVLNVVFAMALIATCYVIQQRARLPAAYSAFALLVIVFGTPMPAVTYTGMEHMMQAWITLLFIYMASGVLAGQASEKARCCVLLLVLAPLVTGARYEGLFVALAVCCLLLVQRRWRLALAVGGLALLPIIVYGIVSVSHGSYWLPNSLLLKGYRPDSYGPAGLARFAYFCWKRLFMNPHILSLMILVALLYARRALRGRETWDRWQAALLLFFMTLAAHMTFAGTGWVWRYESYLVAIGLLLVSIAFFDQLPDSLRDVHGLWSAARRWAGTSMMIGALAVLLLTPFAVRAASYPMIFAGQSNVYGQVYQMGLFLDRCCRGKKVLARDVGAISYLADIRIQDAMGLGTPDAVPLIRARQYDQDAVYRLADKHDCVVTILPDYWNPANESISLLEMKPRLKPPAQWSRWVKLGTWRNRTNYFLGGPSVSIYAIDPSPAARLREALKEFSVLMPPEVVQEGDYLSDRSMPVPAGSSGRDQ